MIQDKCTYTQLTGHDDRALVHSEHCTGRGKMVAAEISGYFRPIILYVACRLLVAATI